MLKISTRNLELGSQNIFIYGPLGIGKTTFFSQRPRTIFIITEPGINFIEGLPHVEGFSMDAIMEFVKDLVARPSEYKEYDTIVIDTADKLLDVTMRKVCRLNNVKFMAEIPHGKGWDQLSTYLKTIIGGIVEAGKSVCFTNHEWSDSRIFTAGEKTKLVPELSRRGRKEILTFVDFIGYLGSGPIGTEKGKRVYGRTITFVPSNDMEAKCRGGIFTEPVIIEPENQAYAKFEEAYHKGIEEKFGGKSDATV